MHGNGIMKSTHLYTKHITRTKRSVWGQINFNSFFLKTQLSWRRRKILVIVNKQIHWFHRFNDYLNVITVLILNCVEWMLLIVSRQVSLTLRVLKQITQYFFYRCCCLLICTRNVEIGWILLKQLCVIFEI